MDSFELKTTSGVTVIRYNDARAEWIARELRRVYGAHRPRLFVVTDEHVALHHLESLLAGLRLAGFDYERIVLAPGEAQKSFVRLRELTDALAMKNFARDDAVLAFGGGVVTDLAGFAASIYRRGIEWIAAPTTVLGMVDAAIGGKTGINHETGKNLIGSFHQPRAVLGATDVLATLPQRESRSGAAEIVKCALLRGGEFWDAVEKAGPDAAQWPAVTLHDFIRRGAQHKCEVVARDEREGGVRALLNLGHTFGHALEQVTGYGTLAHGEAVFYGLRAMVWLSRKVSYMSSDRAEALDRWLARLELPGVNVSPEALVDALSSDKKTLGGSLRWILLREPGAPTICATIPPELVGECAEWLSRIVSCGETIVRARVNKRILVLNGPNLNLLGEREPDIYGEMTHDDLVRVCAESAEAHDCDLLIRQSNSEGDFADYLQWGRRWADGLVLNPGGYTHTSVTIRDALSAARLPAIEVHLSEPRLREEFRHGSLISDLCIGTIAGRGVRGYADAIAELTRSFAETRGG